jgi:hypothetical protein
MQVTTTSTPIPPGELSPSSWPDHTQLPDSDDNFVKNFQEHPQSVINALFKNSHIPSHVRKPLLHKESDGRKSRPIRSLEDEIIWDIIQTKISPLLISLIEHSRAKTTN